MSDALEIGLGLDDDNNIITIGGVDVTNHVVSFILDPVDPGRPRTIRLVLTDINIVGG